MTTQCMKDSLVGDNWIYEGTQANPVQHVLNDQGQPSGNILTGPVRLMFCDALLEPKPGNRKQPESAQNPLKFSCTVLFNPWSDLTVLRQALAGIVDSDFANFKSAGINPSSGLPYGLDDPFFDQGSKAAQYQGFTPGLLGSNLSSNYKPAVVDAHMNPIVDASRIYPGVWAIVSVNAYASGKTAQRKGPRFGIQSVMIIGDDKNCGGGGAADPNAQFKGTTVKPPVAQPGAAFGRPSAPPAGPATGASAAAQVYGTPPAAPPAGFTPPAPPQPGGYAGVTSAPPPAPSEDDMSQFM